MRANGSITKAAWAIIVALGISVLLTEKSRAHCDTMTGPIIPEAKAALEKEDMTPVLKWIKPEKEAELKTAFEKAVKVRGQSDEARELADQYFLETLIRLHREGEGAPFTGLKDGPVAPIVAMADQALNEGSADALTEHLNEHLSQAIREKFQRAMETRAHKDESVEAGRRFVEAYVIYTHYVEGVYETITSAPGHDGEESVRKAHGAEHADHSNADPKYVE
jgi:hypothetical protein